MGVASGRAFNKESRMERKDPNRRADALHPDDVEPGADTRTGVDQVIADWPKEPKASAGRLMKEYGPPDEYSASKLTWYETRDGWKRTELSREEVPHDFPSHHTDFVEQFIDYKVPVDMFSPLAEYDGSVIVDRTKGEMSARCAGTSMNFVAINLAHDIVTRKRTVQQARDEYTKLYQAYKRGEHPPSTRRFEFELPRGDTGDPDVATM
jgi:hypothetical protein